MTVPWTLGPLTGLLTQVPLYGPPIQTSDPKTPDYIQDLGTLGRTLEPGVPTRISDTGTQGRVTTPDDPTRTWDLDDLVPTWGLDDLTSRRLRGDVPPQCS